MLDSPWLDSPWAHGAVRNKGRVRAVADALGAQYNERVISGHNGKNGMVVIAGAATLPAGFGNWVLTFVSAWLLAAGSKRCFQMTHPVLQHLFAPPIESLACGELANRTWARAEMKRRPPKVLKQTPVSTLADALKSSGNLAASWMSFPLGDLHQRGLFAGLYDAFISANATKSEAADEGFQIAVAAHWLLVPLTPAADRVKREYVASLIGKCPGTVPGVAVPYAALAARSGDHAKLATGLRHDANLARWANCTRWFLEHDFRTLQDDKCPLVFAMSDYPPLIPEIFTEIHKDVESEPAGQRSIPPWMVVAEHSLGGVRGVNFTYKDHGQEQVASEIPLWFSSDVPITTNAKPLRWHSGILLPLGQVYQSAVVHHASILSWLVYSEAVAQLQMESSTYSRSAALRGLAMRMEPNHLATLHHTEQAKPFMICRLQSQPPKNQSTTTHTRTHTPKITTTAHRVAAGQAAAQRARPLHAERGHVPAAGRRSEGG
jgi:hypothetical protein